MAGNSGLAAASFVDSFMKGYNFADEAASRKRQQERMDENDAWAREARDRQRTDWQYQDDTRETPEQVQQRRERGNELHGLQLENTRFGLANAKQDREYELATRPTAEQVSEERQLGLEGRRVGVASAKQGMAIRATEAARAARNDSDEQERRKALAAIDFLSSDYAAQFDDPAMQRTALDMDEVLNKGGIRPGITAPAIYDYGNKLFSRELQQGVGGKLKDGSTIEGKRLVAAYSDGDDIMLELDVTARRPDGTVYNYRAPVTKGRTSEDADEVLRIPRAALRDRVRGARYIAQALQMGGSRQDTIAELTRHYLENGGDPKALKDPTKYGYQEVKRGDQIETYETRNGRIAGAPIASGMRFNPNAGLMGFEPTTGGTVTPSAARPSTQPGNEPQPIGRTPDGRPVYQDAQGNRYIEE